MTLHELIRDSGLRRNFIAQKLGVHGSTITHWTQGERVVAQKYVRPLARVLRVREADLQQILANGYATETAG